MDADNQLYDEKELDSERSEDRDEVNALDAEYDAQMLKMQECLGAYFDNVQELQKNPLGKLKAD